MSIYAAGDNLSSAPLGERAAQDGACVTDHTTPPLALHPACDGVLDRGAETGEGDITQELQAGDWVWLCAANGDRQYLAPCQIDTIDFDPDGMPYARFLNMVGEWPPAQCQRADPPAPVAPPDDVEDF